MSEENKILARRFLQEVFSEGDLEEAGELFAEGFVLHDPAIPEEVRGPEGVKGYVGMYRAAYPDTNFTIEDQIAEGDRVVTRWTGRGTHQGELMGVAPTGSRVEVPGILFDRVSEGKIEESWVVYDALGMMRQIGAIPAPEQSEG
jgi:steroid delta-isomerase-like uncharacterized protein